MAIKPLMKNSTAKQLVNAINMLAASQGAQPDVTDWKQVQTTVASGYGPSYFPVGSQLMVNHSVYGAQAFDVVAHNYLRPKGNPNAYTMTIQQHDLLANVQFDAPEAFYYADAELAAGTYNFTITAYNKWVAGTYQFTLTQPVPAGGQLCVSGQYPYQGNITGAKVSSYPSRLSTTAIESVAITEGSGGTSLGTCGVELNHTQRVAYGSNNYKESATRQFLNSTAASGAVWTPQTKFDRPPTWASSYAGYMAGLDEDFLAVVGAVALPCAANNTYEAPDSTVTKGEAYTLYDKFYLASRAEIFSSHDVDDGSVLYPYYEGTTDADRIKYSNGSAASWRLRTPESWSASSMRLVHSDGTMTSGFAYGASGLAPACTIY